ncbi:MAG: hypothetical protein PHY12_08050, partial [Eubacteriales bacterium]|nr:hypothetical protein [Eubacteriales bacterium]
RYLDRRPRAYMQPWIEYNDDVPNELSCSYHFTFSDYLTAALKEGLLLVQTEEPLPPESWKTESPERYDGFLETPSFWVLRLGKK